MMFEVSQPLKKKFLKMEAAPVGELTISSIEAVRPQTSWIPKISKTFPYGEVLVSIGQLNLVVIAVITKTSLM